ncbi:hypothetical protein [Streptomyces sp. ODS28]|uniref:hypothetical protein n=1 Tax=Streptomyces sp. ODS28 TaxID=3136688 RepID=UPI0031E69752
MGHAIEVNAPVRGAPRAGAAARPHLSLTLHVTRAPGAHNWAGEMTHAVLSCCGLPEPMVRHLADAARTAAHFMGGHSSMDAYRLLVRSTPYGVQVTITDYQGRPTDPVPDWLPVAPPAGAHRRQLLPRTSPLRGDDPGAADIHDALLLHRSPDGHTRLDCRVAWPEP